MPVDNADEIAEPPPPALEPDMSIEADAATAAEGESMLDFGKRP